MAGSVNQEDQDNDGVAWGDTPPLPASRRKRMWTYAACAFGLAALWAAVIAAAPLVLRLESRVTISSASMEPTLQEGSTLSYARFYYDIGHLPTRGDVVVFKTKQGVLYAKRIIGLPGDRVQMKRGHLCLNGEALQRSLPKMVRVTGNEGNEEIRSQYAEQLPKGIAYNIYEISDDGPLDDTPEYTVPPGEYFVMGDNRDESIDSRIMDKIGFVPIGSISGRVCETVSGRWL
jgi:signal peptidase I